MDINRNITESMAVLGFIHSASQAAGTVSTGAINTALHRRIRFRIDAGSLGAAGTIDFKVQASTTSGGAYADVAGAAITQITIASGIVLAELEVRAISLASAGVGPWIKGVLTVGTNAVQVSVTVDGTVDRYEPASDNNVANVATPVVF